jgi:hypothetical protein
MKTLLFASSVLCACAAEAPASTTTTLSIETNRYIPISAAIERIDRAQCGRTQTCGTIEQRDASWTTDSCARAARAVRDDMARPSCTSVDSWRLDACFETIGLMSCRRLADTERPPASCSEAALCPRLRPGE